MRKSPLLYQSLPHPILGKSSSFQDDLPVDLLEPLVKLFPSLLTKHRCEILDQLKGLGNEQVHLAKPREIVILPVEALLFRRGHPMGNLQSRWKTLGGTWKVVSFERSTCLNVLAWPLPSKTEQ
jgi:hypothetical protein